MNISVLFAMKWWFYHNMASIEVHCINGPCQSEDVDLTKSIETRSDLVEHRFSCNDCNTTFVIMTEIMDVKVPGEIKQ